MSSEKQAPRGFTLRVERLLEAVSEGVYGLDPDGLTTFVNASAQRMLGYEADELIGRPQHDVIHHQHADGAPFPREACGIYAALRDGDVHTSRSEHFWRRDGSCFPVEYTATPMFEGGEIVGGVVTFRDITVELAAQAEAIERAAQEEARSAEVRAYGQIDEMADGFFAIDSSWRFVWLNRVAEKEFGRPREELIGASFLEAYPEIRDTPLYELYRAAMASGETGEMEFEVVEQQRWFAIRAQPTSRGLGIFFRDVSEAHQARQRLSDSEARYRFLAEAIPQQVWSALPDGSLDWVSPQVLRYFDRSFDEMIGLGWVKVIHPDEVDAVWERWSHSLSTGEPYEVSFRLRRHDGSYRWHLGRAVAQRSADGAIVRWFGTNTDIHEQKLAEAARDQVLGIVSHDLRNPLRVVRHAGELLLRDELPTAVQRHVGLIDRASRSMEELIDNLLDASRLDAGGLVVEPAPTEVVEVFDDVRATMEPLAAKAKVPLRFTSSVQGVVHLDRARVVQALGNLVSNALRFTSARGGEVDVEAVREPEAVVFRVRDTGPGFDEAHLPYLFERYWQHHPGKGAGLGLAIVKGIVDGHGGSVEAHNDGGAVFTLTLPQ